jgi:hypothetical protein
MLPAPFFFKIVYLLGSTTSTERSPLFGQLQVNQRVPFGLICFIPDPSSAVITACSYRGLVLKGTIVNVEGIPETILFRNEEKIQPVRPFIRNRTNNSVTCGNFWKIFEFQIIEVRAKLREIVFVRLRLKTSSV